jgi:tripartite-type tricarboxylate transporter receptor subunit TctC
VSKKTLTALALAFTCVVACAQTYPTKPIRLIVGYPPGGGIDFTARSIQQPLQDALKQQVIVDYKPGAGGMLAAGELTRAAPDGYTLLLANTGPVRHRALPAKPGCRTTPSSSSRTSRRSARAATSPSRGRTTRRRTCASSSPGPRRTSAR